MLQALVVVYMVSDGLLNEYDSTRPSRGNLVDGYPRAQKCIVEPVRGNTTMVCLGYQGNTTEKMKRLFRRVYFIGNWTFTKSNQ